MSDNNNNNSNNSINSNNSNNNNFDPLRRFKNLLRQVVVELGWSEEANDNKKEEIRSHFNALFRDFFFAEKIPESFPSSLRERVGEIENLLTRYADSAWREPDYIETMMEVADEIGLAINTTNFNAMGGRRRLTTKKRSIQRRRKTRRIHHAKKRKTRRTH